MQRLIYFFQFLVLLLFILPFKILPFRWSMAYGRLLTRVIYPFATRYKKIASDNIKLAFPEKDDKWIENTTKKSLIHLGNLIADAIYGGRRADRFLKRHVVIEKKYQEIEKKAIEGGTGIVLIAGHLGLWEMLVWYTGYVLKGGGIYKTLRNPYVDHYYKKTRQASGIELFEMAESGKAIRFIRKGGNLGFVADQNAGPDHLFVDFMNRKAATFRGPAQIADLAGAKMLLYSAILKDDHKIHIYIKDLGFVDRKKFPDRQEAVLHYTKKWVNALEDMIRQYPEQYLWAHRRWKTRPPGE